MAAKLSVFSALPSDLGNSRAPQSQNLLLPERIDRLHTALNQLFLLPLLLSESLQFRQGLPHQTLPHRQSVVRFEQIAQVLRVRSQHSQKAKHQFLFQPAYDVLNYLVLQLLARQHICRQQQSVVRNPFSKRV